MLQMLLHHFCLKKSLEFPLLGAKEKPSLFYSSSFLITGNQVMHFKLHGL